MPVVKPKMLCSYLALLGVSLFLLGSSPCGGYDQSHEYSSLWHNARAVLTPRWTPDGSSIVFGYQGRVYVADALGRDLRSLSGSFEPASLFDDTKKLDFSPSISPDGSRVAYSTLRHARGDLREHTYEIALQNIDGSKRRRLTENDWNDVTPAWSPDGARIAFVSTREDGPRLYTISVDGSDERAIAPSLQVSFEPPAWSPDGSRLAFVAWESEPASIPYLDTRHSDRTPTPGVHEGEISRLVPYAAMSDGSGLTRLEWNHDRSPQPTERIGIRNLGLPEESSGQPVWSPDGSRLAFGAARYRESWALYSIAADGTDHRIVLAPDPTDPIPYGTAVSIRLAPGLYEPITGSYDRYARIFGIRWEHGGDRIAFASIGWVRTPGRDDIVLEPIMEFTVAPADGGGVEDATRLDYEKYGPTGRGGPPIDPIEWAWHGSRIAVHREGSIHTMEPDGSNLREVVRNSGERLAASN